MLRHAFVATAVLMGILSCLAVPLVGGTGSTIRKEKEQPALPKVLGPLAETAASHAFLASAHLKQPLDLERLGYKEEEYFMSGEARVFEWPDGAGPKILA